MSTHPLARRSAQALACALMVACIALTGASARAATVYSVTTPRYYLPSDPNPLYYNVGPFSGPGRILYDDVAVIVDSPRAAGETAERPEVFHLRV